MAGSKLEEANGKSICANRKWSVILSHASADDDNNNNNSASALMNYNYYKRTVL